MIRVDIISDIHVVEDSTMTVNAPTAYNAFLRNFIEGARQLQADHRLLLGDIGAGYPVDSQIVNDMFMSAKEASPKTKVHAVMGNHDFEGFTADITGMSYAPEVTVNVVQNVNIGDTVIYVDDVSSLQVDYPVVICSLPESFPKTDTTTAPTSTTVMYRGKNFPYLDSEHNTNVASIDTVAKTITLPEPITKAFTANNAILRQGNDAQRGFEVFEQMIQGTATPGRKHYFTVGNIVFVMLSMDGYTPRKNYDPVTHQHDIQTEEELTWLEETCNFFYKTHNIIICNHILPDYGVNLGGLNDWGESLGDPSLFGHSETQKARFKQICNDYSVCLWIGGHAHTSMRASQMQVPGSKNLSQGTVAGWGDTWFFLAPNTRDSGNYEGQIPVIDIDNGMTELTIKAYSVEQESFFTDPTFGVQTVPLNYPVDLDYKLTPNVDIVIPVTLPRAFNKVKTIYNVVNLPLYTDETLTTEDNSAGTLILGQINNRTKYILNNTTKVVKTFLRATVAGVNYDSAPQILQPDEAQPFTVNIDLTGVTSVTSVFLYAVTKAVN